MYKRVLSAPPPPFFFFLPSLLLVTGMLWTVRSLKQELVRTCSSTELKTHVWRSGRHRGTAHRNKPLFFPAMPFGLQQTNAFLYREHKWVELSRLYLSSGASGCFPSTLTAHNQRTGGTGSSGGRNKELTTNSWHRKSDLCRYLEKNNNKYTFISLPKVGCEEFTSGLFTSKRLIYAQAKTTFKTTRTHW